MISLQAAFNQRGIDDGYQSIEWFMTRVAQLAQTIPAFRAPVSVGLCAYRAYDHLAKRDKESEWGPNGEKPYQLLQSVANAAVVATSFFRPEGALVLCYLSNSIENLKLAAEAFDKLYDEDKHAAWGYLYNAVFDLTLVALTCTVAPELVIATYAIQMALTLHQTYRDISEQKYGSSESAYCKTAVDLLLMGVIAKVAI